jgi:hypothetical protein
MTVKLNTLQAVADELDDLYGRVVVRCFRRPPSANRLTVIS